MWSTFTSVFSNSTTQPARKPKRAASNDTMQPDPKAALKRTALVDISNRDPANTAGAVTKRSSRTTSKAKENQSKHTAETTTQSSAAIEPVRKVSVNSMVVMPQVFQQQQPQLMSPEPMSLDEHLAATEVLEAPPVAPMNGVRDIDSEDTSDPQFCTSYTQDIHRYLRNVEERFKPSQLSLEHQKDLTPRMRAILVDWLVDVAEEYHLTSESLFLTVNYLDRYISTVKLQSPRNELQLIGIVCCLIACKFEEIHPPLIDDFIYISDYAYTREQILEGEKQVLNALAFELGAATIRNFTKRFIKAADGDQKTRFLAYYLGELTLTDYGFVKYRASLIAACAVCLALHTLGHTDWSATYEYYTEYKTSDPMFQACLRDLFHLYQAAGQREFRSVVEKYSHSPFLKVSLIPPRV